MAILKDELQTSNTNVKESTNWYNNEILKTVKSKNLENDFKQTSQPEIGKMYLYVYDPKYKDILPFYDMFPLTLPINMYNDGFLGLNLHYLPPMARLSLLNALFLVANNDKYNDTTKLNISYDLLRASATRFRGFEECVKRYLYGHVRSSFSIIETQDWGKVAMLPLQRWSVNSNRKYAKAPLY